MSRAIVRSSLLHMLPEQLEQAGIRAEPIFRQAGMTIQHMTEPLPVWRAQIHAALALAAKVTGAPDIGLLLGGAADPAKLGPAGLALLGGATLEACLRNHMALMPRLQTQVDHRLWVEGQSAILSHLLIGDDQSAWLLYEGAAAFNVHLMRQYLGSGWSPDLVTFPHSCRGRAATYETHFGCPVVFGVHSASRIYFPRDLLKAQRRASTLPAAKLNDLLPVGQFCPVQLERFSFDATMIQQAIERMLEATLPHFALTINIAATRLGMSARTLQRRLLDNGWTFESLLDDLRRRLSCDRLKDTKMSVTEIAMALGYSDAAHFSRAFKRWAGVSPSQYRAETMRQAAAQTTARN